MVVRSHIGFGAPHLVDTAKAHGAPLGVEEVRAAKIALGADPDIDFGVSKEVYEHMSQLERGAALEADWNERFERWSVAFPAAREDWDQAWRGEPKPGDATPWTVHWCLAQPVYPMSELGPDGHPTRGGFLPPVPLPLVAPPVPTPPAPPLCVPPVLLPLLLVPPEPPVRAPPVPLPPVPLPV